MILKNKKLLILTSLLILLPIPVGFFLMDRISPEFGFNPAPFFLAPTLTLLAGHWLCVFVTSLDKSNTGKNEKVQKLVLWIIPLLSNFLCAFFYAILLGCEFSPFSWVTALMGLLFLLLGNYMPKTKMNSTIGIKISWTYSSEENWNATHRFAGRVWFFGGLALLPMVFLPGNISVVLMSVVLIAIAALPLWYSWRFYRREKAEGKEIHPRYPTVSKTSRKVSAVFLVILSLFLTVILFTGNIRYRFEDTTFTVEADWYNDLTLSYDTIQSVEYRPVNIAGSRVGGFGSTRLLLGFFRNEEFGNYTRYTYYNPESCIVLNTGRQIIVLSAETPAETQALYETLLSKLS